MRLAMVRSAEAVTELAGEEGDIIIARRRQP
jgi:hypothetical protein